MSDGEIRHRPPWVGTKISEAEWQVARRKVTMPVRLHELLFFGESALQPTPAILELQAWLDDEPDTCVRAGIAVLSGKHGVGKTVAAAWLALNRLAIQEPRFVTAAELYHMPREDRRDHFVHGLILDDLGAEHPQHAGDTKTWRADIDELVDTLYRNCDTAVITTNLTPAEFKARYGERVADRIRECGRWIPVVGKSLRGRR